MTPIIPQVREMSIDEQVEYGLCSRGLMLEQGAHVYRLTAGTTDTVQVYETGGALTYVLTVNYGLEYVALDWYQGREVEPIDGVMIQGSAISEFVGNDWRDMSLLDIAMKLSQLFA